MLPDLIDLPALSSELPLDLAAWKLFADGLEDTTRDDEVIGPQLTLMEFVEQAWSVLFPAEPFVNNWHIDAICGHLQAVTAGVTQRLLINVPPGTSKTLIVAAFWPAWEWTRDSSVKYLCASYDQQTSTDANLHVRNLIASEWYRTNWPNLRLAHDQNQKMRFNTSGGGYRVGTSIGGRATGMHPLRKIVDDPHTVTKSSSALDRETVVNWFKLTLSSRGAGIGATTVVIMQRVHQDDLSGWILANEPDEWVHLMLPMRYEPERQCITHSYVDTVKSLDDEGKEILTFSAPREWHDPRTVKNELLWPAFFTPKKVNDLAARMGPYGVAGQFQQRPSPAGGGMFLDEWFTHIVTGLPSDAHIVARCRYWDCAATDGGGDFTVGLLMAMDTRGRIYIEHVKRGQWGPIEFEGLDGIFQAMAKMDPPGTRIREEEEGGSSGKKVIAAHAQLLHGYDYLGIRSTGDKATRAKPFRTQCAVGNVYLVQGPWNAAFVDELTSFRDDGSDQVDDQVDGASGAYNEIALNVQGQVGTLAIYGW